VQPKENLTMTNSNTPATNDAAINDEALENVAGGHHHHNHHHDNGEGLGFIAGAILGGVAEAIIDPNVHFGVPAPQYVQPPRYVQPQYAQPQYAQPQYVQPQYQQQYVPQPQQYAPQPQQYVQPTAGW
jgi:hypothetical protein